MSSTIFLGSQTIALLLKTVIILTAAAGEQTELKERKKASNLREAKHNSMPASL